MGERKLISTLTFLPTIYNANIPIALYKNSFLLKRVRFLLPIHENIYCGAIESVSMKASNEHLQNMFLL